MPFTLGFLTLFISPSTISFIYISVILLVQAFFTTLDALIAVLAVPLDWSEAFWGNLIYRSTHGFSIVVQETLDCVKIAFVECAFCLLMGLHAHSQPGNGEYWSENDGTSGRIRLEAAKRKNDRKTENRPGSFTTNGVAVEFLVNQGQGHYQRTKLRRPMNSAHASPNQPILIATGDPRTTNRNEYVEVIPVSTPQQSVFSFTQQIRSFIKFSYPFPSPSRSPQLRSRSKYTTRKIRTRRKTGLSNSNSAGSLCGLIYDETSANNGMNNVTPLAAKVLAGVVMENLGPLVQRPSFSKVESTLSMQKDVAFGQRVRRREEGYRTVVASLRKFQSIFDHDEYQALA